ncbi:porin family protein [Prolixibacteraceae bacterium Z1-6]|uniref:Porin family protein n=1 Tax=Draconibacterium aestuarii TaxID=2998507 RepID=A0A9X3FAR5_9BACT|nr:porin family protein [Prolixibacteraceae bacterium Z1-6]
MKPIRVLPILFIVLFVFSARAQYPSVTFMGGVNGATMSYAQSSGETALEDSYKMLFGMNIGALYDHVLKKSRSEEFSVEAGVLFESKGFKQEMDEEGLFLENTTTLYYVDVPLYLKYRYRFRSLNKIYIGAGPYVGYGLFGNSEIAFQYEGADRQSSSEPVWGNESNESDFKRLDYGVTAKAGFLMVNGFNIALSYDYGLPNVAYLDDYQEYKHRLIRLSLGYTLKLED